MIIIEPTRSLKQPFKVRYTAPGNNKNLSHSENLTSKKNCWKSIYSMAKIFLFYKEVKGVFIVTDGSVMEVSIEIWDKTVEGSKPFWYTVSGIKKKAGVRK